jgi:hypothetical protein
MTPNSSIEWTSYGKLRMPAAAAHVERWAARWLSVLNFSGGTMQRKSRSAGTCTKG